ncbi:MAG TPA: hypothetical protein PJ991_07790 [Kiritimatiellia bacterium]|nr:hypothetical protein [Kiritimatiellia bacterium]
MKHREIYPLLITFLLLTGCATISTQIQAPCDNPEERMRDLVARHQQIEQVYNTPMFDDEARWLKSAYEDFIRDCAKHDEQAALATRSIGNIHLALEQIDQAIAWYDRVATNYPDQKWEALQALKSAADTLHDRGDVDRARQYDQRILTLYADENTPDTVAAILRVVRQRTGQP